MNRPIVLFYAAAGASFGYGHLKRCMTLIDEGAGLFEGVLCIRGSTPAFPGHGDLSLSYTVVNTIREAGRIDLIFSDQRDTSQRAMKNFVRSAPVIAMDDRGAGRRFAHTSIFSLPTVEGYGGNFTGPAYIAFDRAVREAGMTVEKGENRTDVVRTNVVVSFGGSDPHNLTGRLAEALNRIGVRPVIVRGPLFKGEWPEGDYTLIDRPENMADILSNCKVLITSFGLTLFEAQYLRVPVILLNHSRYHDKLARAVKGVVNFGYYAAVGRNELSERLETVLKQDFRIHDNESHTEVDGRGTERILDIINKALHAGRQGCLFGHGRYAALNRDNNHTLMVCRKCGDTFLFELESRVDRYEKGDYFLAEYEAQYGKSYIADQKNISRMARSRLDIIEGFLKQKMGVKNHAAQRGTSVQSKRLLDVGCALGFFLDVARQRGWEVTGVEVSGFAAEWAEKHLGLTVVNGSFVDAPLAAESFDAITFFFVVEHFKDVEKVIERAYYALKQGGLLVCALPNGKGISSRIDLKRFVQLHPRDHYFDTCPRNLIRFLRSYGFRKYRVRVTGIHPERFFKKLGVRRNTARLNRLYGAVARVLRLGDTFEYYGSKI